MALSSAPALSVSVTSCETTPAVSSAALMRLKPNVAAAATPAETATNSLRVEPCCSSDIEKPSSGVGPVGRADDNRRHHATRRTAKQHATGDRGRSPVANDK